MASMASPPAQSLRHAPRPRDEGLDPDAIDPEALGAAALGAGLRDPKALDSDLHDSDLHDSDLHDSDLHDPDLHDPAPTDPAALDPGGADPGSAPKESDPRGSALRARVESCTARCPYCHDEIALQGEAWLCCALCLARHHRECWREHGLCASCDNPQALTHVPKAERSIWRAPATRREQVARWATLMIFLIPITLPPMMVVWGQATRSGPAWTSEIENFEAALSRGVRARRAYREFLLARNTGVGDPSDPVQVRARAQRLAKLRGEALDLLQESIDLWEAALGEQFGPGETPPAGYEPYLASLENLRHYQRALSGQVSPPPPEDQPSDPSSPRDPSDPKG